jgi:hypothetical protein
MYLLESTRRSSQEESSPVPVVLAFGGPPGRVMTPNIAGEKTTSDSVYDSIHDKNYHYLTNIDLMRD